MQYRQTIVLLIDALGWEIAEHFDFARLLLPRRRALGTVLGYSSAAIPSLLSGALPSQHRSWAMWRRANGRSPFGFLKFLPPLPHALEWRTRRLARRIADRRGLIRGYYDLYDIPVGVLPHFDVAQSQDPYEPGGLRCETVFDRFVKDGTAYRMWNYRTAESDNMTALVECLGGEASVLFLYTAELDALMHRVGTRDPKVGERLARYQRFLERVVDRAGRGGIDVRLVVLSDHGMTDVSAEVDVWGELNRRGYTLGRDYLAFFDSTMVRIWGSDRVAREAASILDQHGAGRLLGEDELRERGCYFDDHAYGDRVLLLNPGVMVVPSFMGRERIKAMHGYDPDDRHSTGVFLTNEPNTELPDSILGFKDYLLQRVGV